jgi:hypothetical protein
MVAGGGDTDSLLLFWLERGDDGTKCYQKMKQMQRARLSSMGRKRNTTRWNDGVGQRRGATREEKGRRRRQLSSRESY